MVRVRVPLLFLTMKYQIKPFSSELQQSMLMFLKRHEEKTLFLQSNFYNFGPKLTKAPHSGNFKLIYQEEQIVGVFCLSRMGSLLIESEVEEPIFASVLSSCREEPIPIKGLIGRWELCHKLWQYFLEKQVILETTFEEKDFLYSIDLSKTNFTPHYQVQSLFPEHFEAWKLLRCAFAKEMGFPTEHSDEEWKEIYLRKVADKILWGCFLEGQLVSIADLNAKAGDLGQLGGVYTLPEHRQKGLSRAVMQQVLCDAKKKLGLRKLVIFTGKNNLSARNLYESLGGIHIGFYALFFGK